jgi:hypothetical protein
VATIQGFLFFLTKEIYTVGDKERDEGGHIIVPKSRIYSRESYPHFTFLDNLAPVVLASGGVVDRDSVPLVHH